MPAVLKLGVEKVKDLIEQLSEEEQMDIYKSMRRRVLKSQYLKLADSKEGLNISLDDLTEAVESTRSESGSCPSA